MLIIPSQPLAQELPMFYKLGETNAEVQIETAEENKNAALSLVKQAHRSIDIFTQDLDAEIFNNKEFHQHIFALAKKHPTTKIRILVQDSSSAVRNGHCLIRLAQNLTSSISIHNPSREYKNEQCAFMVVDQLGLLYRVSASNRNYRAGVNFMSPLRAEKLTDYFNEVWDQSTPDTQTRRMYM